MSLIQAIIKTASGDVRGRYTVATIADVEAQLDVNAGETYEIESTIETPAPMDGAV